MPQNNTLEFRMCLVDMHFPPTHVERAIQLLLSMIECTKAKPGCRTCMVTRDASDPNRVRYNEEWDSEEAFQRHMHSEEFRRVLVAIDMCCEEPQVVIGDLSGHGGMVYVRKLMEQRGMCV